MKLLLAWPLVAILIVALLGSQLGRYVSAVAWLIVAGATVLVAVALWMAARMAAVPRRIGLVRS